MEFDSDPDDEEDEDTSVTFFLVPYLDNLLEFVFYFLCDPSYLFTDSFINIKSFEGISSSVLSFVTSRR